MVYRTTEDTTWPVDEDGEAQWALRYGDAESREARRMFTASVLNAYAHLTDPAISMKDAIAALRRARRVAAWPDEGATK